MHYLNNLWNELDFGAIGAFLMQLLAVLLCLTVHETCHGLAAYVMGDPTAKRMHRISLNPLHHIDWVGLAAMVLCGFGWAKPVQVDPRYFKNPKRGMALCALAGPVSNLLLAALLITAVRIVYVECGLAYAENPAVAAVIAVNFCLKTALLSIGLGLFNLIPLPPLDGSKVLAALLPDEVYAKWLRYERIGIVLVFALVMLGVGDSVLSDAITGVYAFLVNLIFSI